MPHGVRRELAVSRRGVGEPGRARSSAGSEGMVADTVKRVKRPSGLNVHFEGDRRDNQGRCIPLDELVRLGKDECVALGINRVLIEVCCEHDSSIGRVVPGGCVVVRVTRDSDITESVIREKLLRIVRSNLYEVLVLGKHSLHHWV